MMFSEFVVVGRCDTCPVREWCVHVDGCVYVLCKKNKFVLYAPLVGSRDFTKWLRKKAKNLRANPEVVFEVFKRSYTMMCRNIAPLN